MFDSPLSTRSVRSKSFRFILPVLLGAVVSAWANLTVDDSLNRYSMYGSRWITFDDRASTAIGGWIGSDSLVSFSSNNSIRSVLTSGKDLMVRNGGDTVSGIVNLGRDLTSPNGTFWNAKFLSLVNVKGQVNIQWNNMFDGGVAMGGNRLTVGQWNWNEFNHTRFTSNWQTQYTPPLAIAGLQWQTVLPLPRTGYVLPDTNFAVGTINITGGLAQGRTWRCNDEPVGIPGCIDSILPPGAYGDVKVPYGVTLYLGEGVYKFNSLTMQSSLGTVPTRVLALQPTGSRTVVLLANGLTVGNNPPSAPAVIAPSLYSKGYGSDANHFAGGTMMIVSHVDVNLSNWLDLWATMSVPNDKIEIYQSVKLFGQLFANRIVVHNDFKGTDGAFIPYFPNPPRITVANAGWIGTEGPQGFTQNARFVLNMDHVNGLPVKIFYHTELPTRDTVIATVEHVPAISVAAPPIPQDFVSTSGSVTIAPTLQSDAILIPVHGNGINQPNRYFMVVLDSIQNGTLDSSNLWNGRVAATARILDDDPAPALRIRALPASEGTGPGTKSFRFALALVDSSTGIPLPASLAGGVEFDWSTLTATAVASDFTPVSMRFARWAPGQSTDTLDVQVRQDSSYEYNETFQVSVSPVMGFTTMGSNLSATGTILNDDNRPLLWIRDTSIRRDPTAWTTMKFVVSLLDSATGQILTENGVPTVFNWRTVPGSAIADTDFIAASGTMTFDPGRTTDTILIQVRGDARYHPPLSFSIDLSTPNTVSPSSRFTAVGTIFSAVGRPTLAVDSSRIPEGDAGRKPFGFSIALRDSATGDPVTSRVPVPFRWSSTGVTAMVGTDFVTKNGNSILPAGRSRIDIVADSVIGNRIHQADRILALLVTPSLSGFSPVTANGTIVDDDPAPLVRIDDASAIRDTVPGSQTPLWFKVHLVDPRTGQPIASGLPVVLHWKTLDSTATAGLDYVAGKGRLTIPVGSSLDSLSVNLLGDARFSPSNAFKVALDTLVGAARGDTTAVGSISGGARKPLLALEGGSVLRPTEVGSTAPLPFAYFLVDPVTGVRTSSRVKVGFSWSTFDSTALAGRDYVQVTNAPDAVRPGTPNDTLEVTVHGFSTFATPRFVGVHATILDTTWISGDTIRAHTIGTIFDSAADIGRFVTRDASILEPSTSAGTVVDVVVRLEIPIASGTVHLPLVFDTAHSTAVPGVNFRLIDSLAVFPPGDTLTTIHLELLHDGTYTGPLSIRLDLLANVAENIATGDPDVLTITLLDVDPQPTISFVDTLLAVRESDTMVPVLLQLDHPSAFAIAGNLGVVGGSARDGIDFQLGAGNFLFSPGRRLDTVWLQIKNDHRYGPDRDVILKGVRLADTAQATFATVQDRERIVILESDPKPILAFAQDTMFVSDRDGFADLPILLSEVSDSVAMAGLVLDSKRGSVTGLGLVADSAYSVRIDTGALKTGFRVWFDDDGKVGPDRIAHLVLRDPSGAALGTDSMLVLVIKNTNQAPVVRILTPLDSSHTSNPIQRIEWTVDGVLQTIADTVLHEGWNAISRCFTDTAGNTGCDTHRVWGDFTPPSVRVFKIVGPNPLDPSRDTTWWSDKARTRFGKDTIWYWSRDSILDADGIWRVVVDTFQVATDFQGDGLFPTEAKVCDSVGNCGVDTGWIDLKQSRPVVRILTPPAGSHVVVGRFPVAWSVTDDGRTWIASNTQDAPVPGPLTITRCYTDDVGNRGCGSAPVIVEAIQVLDAKYLDLDGDGRIDAAVVDLDSRWVGGTLPTFDFWFDDSVRTGKIPNPKSPFYAGSPRGIRMVAGTDTFWVEVGASITDSVGKLLFGPDGRPLTGILGDTAFGVDGIALRDEIGRIYFRVAGPGKPDSTRFVVPIAPPFAFGMTGFDSTQPARMTSEWTIKDGLGQTESVKAIDSFRVRDGVAPVIVKAEVHRVEKYRSLDTLLLTLSESIHLGEGRDWLQVGKCRSTTQTCDVRDLVWIDVPDSLVDVLPDGRYRFLVPTDSVGIRPDYQVRLRADVADTKGNGIDTANLHWSTVVAGPPRPALVVMSPPSRIPSLPMSERERRGPGGIVFRATKGPGGESSLQWWQPGRGYLSPSDPSVTSICPDRLFCNGPKVYINRPARILIYIYDNAGMFVTKRSLDISRQDLENIEPDQLDRMSIEFDWNHRNDEGKLVASGVYCWRIVTYLSQPGGRLPAISNQIYKVGVKIPQRGG